MRGKFWLFHGEETYMMERYVEKIVNDLLSPTMMDWNYETFYGKDIEANDFIRITETLPMMDEVKIIRIMDIHDAFSGSFEKALEKDMDDLGDHVIIIGVDNAKQVKKNERIYRYAKKKKTVVDFPKLTYHQFQQFINTQAEQVGLNVTAVQCKKLFQLSGYDFRGSELNLYDLAEGMNLLGSYCEEGKITDEAIELFWPRDIQYNIFQLLDAIDAKDSERVWRIWHDMYRNNENEFRVLSMIIRHFRLLDKYKVLKSEGFGPKELRDSLGIKRFEFQKIEREARKWEHANLKSVLNECLETEKKMKSQSVDTAFLMELLIAGILQKK